MNDTASLSQTIGKKKLFIISDLHIGDGSARDNLLKHDKRILFQRFLDEVERQDGMLMILGDFLELWRYRCDDILEYWHRLLSRLAKMHLIYVPGNHDAVHTQAFDRYRQMHPIFTRLCHPFVKTIGGRRFKFMHGHEVDPMITNAFQKFTPLLRMITGALEYRQDMCLMTNDAVSDILLEAGERAVHLWHRLTRQINHSVLEHLGLSNETWTQLTRPIRTHNMLARFYKEQQQGLYDVTVTGHTHKAGYFGDWYFNCGCWTHNIVNYMTVTPDGMIRIFNWTYDGPQQNSAVVA